jgi:hypothetical protein
MPSLRVDSPPMSLWDERAAANEALFRSVNEQVSHLAGRHYGPLEPTGFVCECADDSCTERIYVPFEIYETVRAHPRHFLVAAGHEDGEIEKIVDTGAGFAVVEKKGSAGEVADETDPRG